MASKHAFTHTTFSSRLQDGKRFGDLEKGATELEYRVCLGVLANYCIYGIQHTTLAGLTLVGPTTNNLFTFRTQMCIIVLIGPN